MTTTAIDSDSLKSEVAVTTTDDDTLIGEIVGFVNRWLVTRLDRDLDQASYTHTLNGTGQQVLPLLQWPATTITSVKISQDWQFATVTAEDSDDYAIDDDNPRHLIYRISRWPIGKRNIQVAYTAGYASGSIPGDIEAAARWIGAWIYRNTQEKTHGTGSKSSPSQSISFDVSQLPLIHKQTLDRYERRGL